MKKKHKLITYRVSGTLFTVTDNYKDLKPLGSGAYGTAVAAYDSDKKIMVAIKKMTIRDREFEFMKRVLREICILRHFSPHHNLINLLDLIPPQNYETFDDVYHVTELMDCELRRIIKSNGELKDADCQYFLYQLLRGMKFVHSANVLHRDLKPSNILVDHEMNVRICDFGLARGIDAENPEMSTQYVATRWYRAPELLLMWESCSKEQDVWSIGCIFWELIANPRRPLFPGKDYLSQLGLILDFCGTPTKEEVHGCDRALKYLWEQPHRDGIDIYSHPSLKDANPDAIDLLRKLLAFDPTKRVTIQQALHHPYVKELQEDDDEPEAEKFIFRHEDLFAKNGENVDIKKLMYNEIMEYRRKFHGDQGDFEVVEGIIECDELQL